MRTVRLWAASILSAISAPVLAGEVALTFDDVPTYGHYRTLPDAERLTDKLLDGLRRNHLPAIGFDNEIQLEGPDKPCRVELLERWLDARMELGNHGYSHLSLNRTPLDRYVADTARGETITRPLVTSHGQTEHWFRYPYLATGLTLDTRRAFETWLSAHNYRVAPVTMENSDWEFADVYDDALGRGDLAAAVHIREEYIAFTAAIVGWYRHAAMALFGHEIRYVFLLHASQLNADSVDELAATLRHHHLRAVPIERAMQDPVYANADDYAGPNGDEWLTRWSTTFHKSLPYGRLPQIPVSIAAAETVLSRRPASALSRISR